MMLRRFQGQIVPLSRRALGARSTSRSLGYLLQASASRLPSQCLRDSLQYASRRGYAQGPPGGGGGGGFPGFSFQQQQRQKGDALKEYVSSLPRPEYSIPSLIMTIYHF